MPPTRAEIASAARQVGARHGIVSFRRPVRDRRGSGDVHFSVQNTLITLFLGAMVCLAGTVDTPIGPALNLLTTLCHEVGHAVSATLLGSPSLPEIHADGHAAAIHTKEQIYFM